jgi:hypothetical protein
LQTQAEQNEKTAEIAGPLSDAAGSMADAVADLRAHQPADASTDQRTAIDAIQRAIDFLQQLEDQQRGDDEQDQLAQLAQQYAKLAEDQHALREQVQPFVDEPRLDRRRRAELRQLAPQQQALNDRADELGEKIAGQVVFEHTQSRATEAMRRAADAIAQGTHDASLSYDQRLATDALRMMAQALTPPKADDRFDRASASGSGGGGGSGARGNPVPPAAQVKLLRQIQERLRDQTREAHETNQPADLSDLAQQQRDLANLGAQLLQKPQQPPAPGTTPAP